MDRALALDIAMALMVFGFIGGRALHVAYEEPLLYWNHPAEILRFWHGGFVFFGGAAAAIGAGALVARRRGARFAEWADFFAPLGALGYLLGRVSCWLTGCCFGRICYLPAASLAFRLPTQLLAAATESAALASLLWLERARRQWRNTPLLSSSPVGPPGSSGAWPAIRAAARALAQRPGAEFALWLTLHSLGRLAMEAWRADDRGPEPLGASISSWISAAILFAVAAWVALAARRARHERSDRLLAPLRARARP
jgi:phosphatidylglycerol:prolipoprotein diacylglycerol transferase